ncbi:hypothetical protein OG21DRAFT_1490408 [Imleria badia]|nr:hypothetical protein OG21DRAFT_1490408 [Imleria badia]
MKNRAAVHPKPRIVKKDPQVEMPVILEPRYPHLEDKAGMTSLREVLAEAMRQRLREANTSVPRASAADTDTDTMTGEHSAQATKSRAVITDADGESGECCTSNLSHRVHISTALTDTDDESDEHLSPAPAKTAVGVVDGALFKKVKTNAAGTGDNVTQAVTSAKGITHAVSSRKATSAVTSKRKYTKSDLPELMRDDTEDKWSKKVIPSLILWYGDERNIWSVGEEDLSSVLARIIKVVYPTFNKPDEINYGLPIYGLVRLTLVVHAP